jgi:Mannosyl-glycoprotein endo-beta-N-acetylglucosaminidase
MPNGTINTWSVKLRDGPDGKELPGFVAMGAEVDVKADDGSGWLLVVAEIDGQRRLGFLDGCYVLLDQDERTPTIPTTPPGGFTGDVVSAAQEAGRKLHIPASVTLAQWALESSFGRLTPPASNNPFAIEAVDGQEYVVARTKRIVDGKSTYVLAHFRQFASIAEAINSHVQVLAEGADYAKARMALPDPNRFADALADVCNHDPRYGASLRQIIRTYNLTQFD